ncbi:MAG TPA: hypothetical protein DIW31_05435 [Bacteroidales bacterium]|nr:hypothetical protein [Bacteroidales bacterium]
MIRGSWEKDFFAGLILFFVVFQANGAFSQNAKSDSLINLFNKSTSDYDKMKLANRIASLNVNTDSTLFLFYTNEVIRLSEKEHNNSYRGYAYFNLGSFYGEKNILKALDYSNKSLSIFTEIDSLNSVAMVQTLIGSIYFYNGNYSKSYKSFLESLKINERNGNIFALGTDYNNIAIIYSAQKNQYKAIEYYKKALQFGEKYNDKELYSTLLLNISVSYTELDSLEQALQYAHMAYDSLIKTEYKEMLPHVLLNLSELYIRTDNLDKAEAYLKDVEQIINKSNKYYFLFYNITKGKLLSAKHNYNEAIKVYEFCYNESIKEGIFPFAQDVSEDLSKIYKSINMYKEGLFYTERFHAIRDSLTNSEKIKYITELELQYKFDKQLDIKLKEEINQKKLLSLQLKIIVFSLVALAFAIAVVILTVYNYKSKQKSYSLLNEKNSQIQKQSDELKDQRDKLHHLNLSKDKINSIIAHDLKNQFNSMLGFTRLIIDNWHDLDENRKLLYLRKVDESTMHSFNLLNSLLEWSLSQTGNIKVNTECIELKIIADNSIANLYAQAKAKRIKIENRIDSSINIKTDAIMLSSILRNIVSNAVKFTNVDGKIWISCISKKEGYISIEIQDSGVGMSQDVLGSLFNIKTHTTTYGTGNEKGTGLGLLICKDFVELNNGWIDVESELGVGTKFTITLPSC